jgi:hypothetical protein
MHGKPIAAVIVSFGLGCGAALAGDMMSKDAYKAEKERIKAAYKADDDRRCKSLSGNAKDICHAETSARLKISLAELDARNENTHKARETAMVVRADAIHAVDVQKCDDLAGQKKDVCRQEAKSMRDKVKADAKAERQSASAQMAANEKIADARKDAGQAKRDADYRVAMERCDAFADERKDLCVKDAKARFGK